MSDLYRNNVSVNAPSDAVFNPPLDGILVVVAANAGQGVVLEIYMDGQQIGGSDYNFPHTLLVGGTHLNVGGITRIVSTGNSIQYIGLRHRSSSGSSNTVSDNIVASGGGDGGG